MAKQKTIYKCALCGFENPQWLGQCRECGEWNTLEPVEIYKKASVRREKGALSTKVLNLSEVSVKSTERMSSNIGEFDRVLGGGFVPGQVIIIAGEPGIGKSTLLTQLAKSLRDKKIIYVCGEESVGQVKLRTQRMGIDSGSLYLVSETDTDILIETLYSEDDIDLIIVDSVQTLHSEDFNGIAGSISQIRGNTQKLTITAKELSVPLILVGHVTKEGSVAGPKMLEHMVDTVLYLEGDSQHLYRVLKTSKNRFGPVSEIGIFEMDETGMVEVKNPSQIFMEQRDASASGSCITVVMEGFRPILFEIQALTSRTAFGYPRRTASGFSVNRLQVLIAILEKRCGLDLSNMDVYLSVSGGFRITEYACDLAVCTAIASALKDVPIKKDAVVFGECGLSGEVRQVPHQKKRVEEARRLGFTNIISSDNVKSVREALGMSLERR